MDPTDDIPSTECVPTLDIEGDELLELGGPLLSSLTAVRGLEFRLVSELEEGGLRGGDTEEDRDRSGVSMSMLSLLSLSGEDDCPWSPIRPCLLK